MASNTFNPDELKAHKKVKVWDEAKRRPFLLISSALLLIYGIIFYYIPVLGWVTAFQDYKPAKGFLASKWVGLEKFKKLFEQDTTLLDSDKALAEEGDVEVDLALFEDEMENLDISMFHS